MKGFKDSKGKFRPTGNNKSVRKSRDQSTKTQGVKIQPRMSREKRNPLEPVLEKTEKEFEKSLKEYDFKNPNLRNKDWEVSITYEGGFSEEYFRFWAQIKGTDKSVTYRSFLSNFEWSEGMDEKWQKRIENDDKFAQKQYDIWLADSFDTVSDGFFEQFVDAIEEEA